MRHPDEAKEFLYQLDPFIVDAKQRPDGGIATGAVHLRDAVDLMGWDAVLAEYPHIGNMLSVATGERDAPRNTAERDAFRRGGAVV